jgi:hypothetical protein
MKKIIRTIKILILRALLTAPFYVVGFRLLMSMENIEDASEMSTAAAVALLGLAILIVGTIVLMLPLARLAAMPFVSIYFPKNDNEDEIPAPSYYAPHAKKVKGMYDDAIEHYERIARMFPNEVRPYIEIIDICVVNLGDVDRATDAYHLGMMKLKLKRDQRILDDMFTSTITRLNPDPEWLAKQKERRLALNSDAWMADVPQPKEIGVAASEGRPGEEVVPITVEDLSLADQHAAKLRAHMAARDEDEGIVADTDEELDDEDEVSCDDEPIGVDEALRDAEDALSEAQAELKKDKTASSDDPA